MSNRERPRKVRADNPGASVRKKSSPKNEQRVEDKKTTGAKSSCPSKLQKSEEVRPRKPRCSEKDNSVEDNPSKDLKDATEKVKKSQRSQPGKTTDVKVSRSSRLQESQKACPRKSPRDATATVETHVTKPAKSGEKKTGSISCARKGNSIDGNPTKALQAVLERLKVKKSERSESSRCVNDVQSKITEYLKRHLDWCKDIRVLKTGSYYENVKICEPDEFDVMLTVLVERVNIRPFSEDGAFYSVEMKRHTQRHPLDKFVNKDNTIMASEMRKEFREKVKEAVATLPNVTLEKTKMGCPAVTLLVKDNSKHISIDFVLSLEVHSSWPEFTQDGFNIENWLSRKVRMGQRRKPFYLVNKYTGRGNSEQDGIMAKDTWRISFSHVEKDILKNHGNSKTCCEGSQKCCRKQCLKLLKYLLQRLKEEHPEEADKLYSYHAKTALLHACAARVKDSEWEGSELSYCFEQLLCDFEQYLRTCQLPNFFIPSQNLFSNLSKKKCNILADHIEKQRNNGFPLLC